MSISTKKFQALVFLLLFCGAAPVSAADDPAALAEAALAKNDTRTADYWLAAGLAGGAADKELEPVLSKRHIAPGGFLSSRYDPEFTDWFVRSIRPRWGVKANRPGGVVEIAKSAFGVYYASVGAAPELVNFFRPEGEKASEPLLLTLAGTKPRPSLYAGKQINGQPATEFPSVALGTGRHAIHYVWTPEFYDLDGDGTPEIWVRYNMIWGNGFRQLLDIYRIKNGGSLELVKRFTGDSEGLARRLEGSKVEVRRGVGSKPGLSHFDFDRQHTEIWLYKGGAFKKIYQADIPHALLDKSWKETV